MDPHKSNWPLKTKMYIWKPKVAADQATLQRPCRRWRHRKHINHWEKRGPRTPFNIFYPLSILAFFTCPLCIFTPRMLIGMHTRLAEGVRLRNPRKSLLTLTSPMLEVAATEELQAKELLKPRAAGFFISGTTPRAENSVQLGSSSAAAAPL